MPNCPTANSPAVVYSSSSRGASGKISRLWIVASTQIEEISRRGPGQLRRHGVRIAIGPLLANLQPVACEVPPHRVRHCARTSTSSNRCESRGSMPSCIPGGGAKSIRERRSRTAIAERRDPACPADSDCEVGIGIRARARFCGQPSRGSCPAIARATSNRNVAQASVCPSLSYSAASMAPAGRARRGAMMDNRALAIIGDTLFPIIRKLCQTVG